MQKEYVLRLIGFGFVVFLQGTMLFNELTPRGYSSGESRPIDWSSAQTKLFTAILFTIMWVRCILGYFTLRQFKKAEDASASSE
ncbi:hypothetical protein M3231_21725 [Neobacillus mesonae]|nr:hypothetical protein [Neobacillus mesonae]